MDNFKWLDRNASYYPILFDIEGCIKCYETELIVKKDSDDNFIYNNIVIKDESIIEFSYLENKWIPLRVRDDKTKTYENEKIKKQFKTK